VKLDILVKDGDSGQPVRGAAIRIVDPLLTWRKSEGRTSANGHAWIEYPFRAAIERKWHRTRAQVYFPCWLEVSCDGYQSRFLFLAELLGEERSLNQLPPPCQTIALRKGSTPDPQLGDLVGKYHFKSLDGSITILPDGRFAGDVNGQQGGAIPYGFVRWEKDELVLSPARRRYDGALPGDFRRYVPVRKNDRIYLVAKGSVQHLEEVLAKDQYSFFLEYGFKDAPKSTPISVTPGSAF
jgi:hypothetical protein